MRENVESANPSAKAENGSAAEPTGKAAKNAFAVRSNSKQVARVVPRVKLREPLFSLGRSNRLTPRNTSADARDSGLQKNTTTHQQGRS